MRAQSNGDKAVGPGRGGNCQESKHIFLAVLCGGLKWGSQRVGGGYYWTCHYTILGQEIHSLVMA
jgi:hypothetical protein